MRAEIIRFEDIELDLGRYELRRAGRSIRLEKQPLDLLELLVVKRGQLVTREEIIEKLWGKNVFLDAEQGINNAIHKIRLALGDDPAQPRFVHTVVGRGYRFVAGVTVVPSETSAQVSPPPDIRRIQSIAVLPLENLSGDPRQEYFADGMTEAVIAELSKIGKLKVISRTSAMQYKSVKKPLPQIARELGVDGLIEGSVLREDDHVRVMVQLIHGMTDQHLWTESYQREMRGILALQSEVAHAIGEEIRVSVTLEERKRLSSARPVSPEAHELYLKGRYYWNKRTEDGVKKGIEYFQRAIEKDPDYAVAYAGLADSYTEPAFLGVVTLPPREAMPRAKAAATKALELDPMLAEAHTSLAYVRLHYDWEWAAAEREFQRAIELNRSYADAHHFYSHYLMAMGRTEESLTESRRALELDPVDSIMNVHLGWHYLCARQYDRAIEQLRITLELDPNIPQPHQFLGEAYEQKGMYPEAIAEFQKAKRLDNTPRTLAFLGCAYAASAQRDQARKVFDELKELSKQRYVPPYFAAVLCAGLGEKDGAFEWLQKAREERSESLIYLKVERALDSLRSDPRFQDLVCRVGLPS